MHWPALGTFHFGADGPVRADAPHHTRREQLQDAYLRGVLPVALLGRECEALHASAVLTPAGVIAFCARSGTGKSSLARGIARSHGVQWADDTVILEVDGRDVRTVALPFTPRLDAAAAAALRLPADSATRAGSPAPAQTAALQRVYFLDRDLDVDPTEPSIRPLAPAPAFERLLAHAHPFDLAGPDRRRRMIERLLFAAGTVTMFELRFAPSLAYLPSLVARVSEDIDL
jgi:hypothetical protein